MSKRFASGDQEVVALDSINMTVDDCEIVALLGPSGCGKSTLLRIVGGLLSPSEGKVTVFGHTVREPNPIMGMMFQRPILFPWLTVVENILLPIRVRQESPGRTDMNDYKQRALDLVELVGLEGFADRYPSQLSGGMQQRAAICRMLINEPKLLLLDEPFGALDELTREYMDSELRRIIVDGNRAAVLVTHNPLEAAFIADRVIVLTPRPGQVAGEVVIDLGRDRPKELLDSPDLHAHIASVRQLFEDHRGAAPE